MYKKLTDYQKAELWSQIYIVSLSIVKNSKNKQDLIEFRKKAEDLEEFLKKLTNHEIAKAIEQSENR